MTLRRRLTVSYAVVLTGCLLLMGAAAYYEFVVEFQDHGHEPGFSMTWEVMEVVLGAGIPALAIGVLGGWWLVRRSLRPIAELTAAAERLHEGNLQELLPRSRNGDEIDRLSEVLNDFTGRLGASVGQMREFTFHASHELKTPLTIMRGELEVALRDDFSKADPRALCVSQLEEIRRLSRIVESLTLLAKADASLLRLDRQVIPLHELVKEAVDDADTLSEGQVVRIGRCDECAIPGDRDRLRQLLLNLVDNAVKYNTPGGGTIRFSLAREEGRVVCRIVNSGPGLAEENCAKVFDRFYRGGSAHPKPIEGSGLGLSLCRWIAEAHGGSIDFRSSAGGDTTVTLILPTHA